MMTRRLDSGISPSNPRHKTNNEVQSSGRGVLFTDLDGTKLLFDKMDIPESLITDRFDDLTMKGFDALSNMDKYIVLAISYYNERRFMYGSTLDFTKQTVGEIFAQSWAYSPDMDEMLNGLGWAALAPVFAAKYGYPPDAFESCKDYEENQMLFCTAMIPLPAGWESLQTLTEEKFLQQLNEFFSLITGGEQEAFQKLELCERWTKV